ncbi:hypothetical protein PM3016_3784 [Paenibacillus mucilaginosus 3016]|uniref:Uncharacterized protein n=2 Tax=Paenibacillus mucilaginosus TaxID=61624 RepID=H6ND84_9BACL|nr:hypothetical protein PM3016_3784 [Paenibacillus mucilaginosus 3016]AFH62903.1 hypothetical protein B2K_19670 [Paenibacillus mucilaginosus K02]
MMMDTFINMSELLNPLLQVCPMFIVILPLRQ